MSGPEPSNLAAWTARWRLIASIVGFWVGIIIFVFDAMIQPPADPVTSGFALVLTGLGPAAAIDFLKSKGGGS